MSGKIIKYFVVALPDLSLTNRSSLKGTRQGSTLPGCFPKAPKAWPGRAIPWPRSLLLYSNLLHCMHSRDLQWVSTEPWPDPEVLLVHFRARLWAGSNHYSLVRPARLQHISKCVLNNYSLFF